MKYQLAAASVVALIVAAPAWAQTGTTSPGAAGQTTAPSGGASLSQQDRQFMNDAAAGGLAEVELGKIAEQKATDPAVREYGRWMVTDHTLANHMLQQVAQNLGVQVPNQLNAHYQQTEQRLSGLSGTQFDRQYIQEMVTEHQQDVPMFQKMAQSAQAPQLKAFAQEVTPVLQQHLAEAQELAGSGPTAAGSRTGSIEGTDSGSTGSGAGSSMGASGTQRQRRANMATDEQTRQLNQQELTRLKSQ